MINQRLEELVAMTVYVGKVLDSDIDTFDKLLNIRQYYELLNLPLNKDMFLTDKPLFPGFKELTQSAAIKNKIKQSFWMSEDGTFNVTLYRSREDGMCYITTFHLKTVEDLCGKGIEYDDEIRQFWVDEMRDTKKCRNCINFYDMTENKEFGKCKLRSLIYCKEGDGDFIVSVDNEIQSESWCDEWSAE